MRDMAKTTRRPNSEEVMEFKIKRSHFWALLAPLTFLAGLGVGFVMWGNDSPQTAAVLPTAAAGAGSNNADIASQLATITRYDVQISADDPVLGDEDAPITIVEFADFQCPFCIRHFQEVYPQLVAQYGDQIRFVYKDYPLSTLHPDAYSAALAAQCAKEQGKFWEYHDLLFGGTQGLGREAYDAYAAQLGLDVAAMNACMDEDRYGDAVQADYTEGAGLGVNSTPTFFVNGVAVVGAQPFALFAEIIDYELERTN
jgi:protein-disulfide isomerase